MSNNTALMLPASLRRPKARAVRHGTARVMRLFDGTFALLVMLVTFTAVNLGRMPGGLDEFMAGRLTVKNIALVCGFVVCWCWCFSLCGLYRANSRSSIGSLAARIVLACTLGTVLLSLFLIATNGGAFGLRVAVDSGGLALSPSWFHGPPRLEFVLWFWLAGALVELLGPGRDRRQRQLP